MITDLKSFKKAILAYSGGLDTTVLVPWLKEQGVQEIVCAAADVGQISDAKTLENKALTTGADKFVLLNLKEEFIKDYVFPCIQAGARYEGSYLLGTAMARPLIAKALVDLAHEEKTNLIVHGCTGKGNDQVRFELTMAALDPSIEVVAPWRFWDIKSRSQEIKYVKDHGIDLDFDENESYSMDENLWHLSHEGLDLELPSNAADLKHILKWVTPPEEAPDLPEEITIDYEKGIPIALNGEKMKPVELITELNKLGSKHGIGFDDIVENRLVGMKSRGVYENPAGTILYFAHDKLESITLDVDTIHFKQPLSYKYAELVYNGKWETPLMEALNAFVKTTQTSVNGRVKLNLYKGNVYILELHSDDSLFSEEHATFEEAESYDHADASGFIKLYSLSTKIKAQLRNK